MSEFDEKGVKRTIGIERGVYNGLGEVELQVTVRRRLCNWERGGRSPNFLRRAPIPFGTVAS